MEEKNGNLNEEFAKKVDLIPDEEVLAEYHETFGAIPPIPMMLCSGQDDPEYLAMLRHCLKNNTPVDEEIEEQFFPMEKDADY